MRLLVLAVILAPMCCLHLFFPQTYSMEMVFLFRSFIPSVLTGFTLFGYADRIFLKFDLLLEKEIKVLTNNNLDEPLITQKHTV